MSCPLPARPVYAKAEQVRIVSGNYNFEYATLEDEMKSYTTFLVIIAFSLANFGCATKKVYVPKQMAVSPRVGFLNKENVDLAIFDGRVEKERSVELINQIANQIIKTYPSTNFNLVDERGFYSDAQPNRITIKIALAVYSSGFGNNITVGIGSVGGQFSYGVIPEGKWNGITGFSVNIYDYRKGTEIKFTKDIGKLVSKPNLWGYKTAKSALDESYQAAMQELLFFIDNSLMK